jgi:hypothetical protein
LWNDEIVETKRPEGAAGATNEISAVIYIRITQMPVLDHFLHRSLQKGLSLASNDRHSGEIITNMMKPHELLRILEDLYEQITDDKLRWRADDAPCLATEQKTADWEAANIILASGDWEQASQKMDSESEETEKKRPAHSSQVGDMAAAVLLYRRAVRSLLLHGCWRRIGPDSILVLFIPRSGSYSH